jgi:HlyD family secretion protein
MGKRLLVGAAVVAALALVVFASLRASGSGPQTRVYAEAAERRSITHTVTASGQIHPRVKVNISAHVVGKIEKLHVRDGDPIEAGRPFLQLEQQAFLAARDDARARLGMAQTELQRSEVALADQKVRLERARRLRGEGVVSIETLESAELQHRTAELATITAREGVDQARALLEKAEDDLRKTTIWAPISGRVIALNAEEGEVVVSGTMNNPASVIGTIADLSEVLAEVDVDETEVVDVRPGLAAEIEVDAVPGAKYAGKVVEVGSSGYAKATQPDVQFFLVRILLEAPDEKLRPGMSARARIRVETHDDAVVVPIQAVVERAPAGRGDEAGAGATARAAGDEEVPVVFVVDADRVRQRPVETGIADATDVELTSGVAAGDRVVTGPYRSLKKLRDGDRVKVATAGERDDEDEDAEE